MKTSLWLCVCALVSLPLAPTRAGQQTPYEIARSFLPPGTRMAELQHFDPKTGKSIEGAPAVFSGHFISPDSDDIAFAYVNTAPETKSLFVGVLHRLSSGYVEVFNRSYYERYLWVQNFATVGFKILTLPGESVDSLSISTARGASLGVQTELYHWVDGAGMVNVMPSHPPAHQIAFFFKDNQFMLKLSFAKYPGEKGVRQPIVYRWDGRQMTRTG